MALITVDKEGENCIAVASGANAALTPADVEKASGEIEKSSMVLMQLETPLPTINYAAGLARSQNILVILNPAPACTLPDGLLQNISIITPNETEAEMLTGIKVLDERSAAKAAQVLREKGVETVIITLGAKGAFLSTATGEWLVPAPVVEAVDTTAAGDVFNGALAVALAESQPLPEAVAFACHAAAIAVTRLGAQAAAPHRAEVISFMSVPKQKASVS